MAARKKTSGMTETTGRSTALAMDSVPIDSLIPHPKNARQGDLGAVIESVRENGCYRPLICQRSTRYILAGNHLWRALQSEGYQQVNVVWIDCDPDRALRILLVDNRANDLASYDNNALAELLQSLPDLSGTGFDAESLDELLADLGQGGTAGLTPEDDVPPVPVAPVSVLGDLWLLGEHRVLCGDSTSVDAVARLCGATLADLVFTDPPYGIKYRDTGAGAWGEKKLALKKAGLLKPRFEAIEGDNLSGTELLDFLREAFVTTSTVCSPTAAWYVWHAAQTSSTFELALSEAGYRMRSVIIWAKSRPAFNFSQYKYQHEPCFYAFRDGNAPLWVGDLSQTTLWEVPSESGETYRHPTQKPVALAEKAIGNSTKAGGIVLDPFLGSGSTLIACEKTGRICYGMELSPAYCDVIVKRWQEFTGKEAKLGDGPYKGTTFEEAKRGRRQAAADEIMEEALSA